MKREAQAQKAMLLGGESGVYSDIFSGLCSLIYTIEIWLKGMISYLKNLWNILKPDMLVLLSLILQIVLISLGNRRKHVAHAPLQLAVWFAYLLADGVAISALSILSQNSKEWPSDPSFVIMVPFLLLHLGGPDGITAYALEDNELWWRHILQLIYQIVIAVVVVAKLGTGSNLNYIIIPMMTAAIIKCGERIWAQRLGSIKYLRESILRNPDPGPNYAKFMDEYSARKAEGYKVKIGKVIETTPTVLGHSQGAIVNDSIPDAPAIHDGFYFFESFKCLFADLIHSFQDHEKSQKNFQQKSWSHAFKVTEVVLVLMYDRLYTKAVLTYSIRGLILKIVSTFCTVCAFITFYKIDKGQTNFDKIVMIYVLFIGSFFLELYAANVILSSNWVMLRLSGLEKWKVDLLCKYISCFQRLSKLSHTVRWTNRMSQFNFMSFCLKDKPIKCIGIQKFFHIYQFFEKSYYQDEENVPSELKELIFDRLWEKSWHASDIEACKELCARRGDRVFEKWVCRVGENSNKWNYKILDWSIKVEFDQSILLWHIATDLCYYADGDHNSDNVKLKRRITSSRLLLNYMMYLLVVNPSMLPTGIGQIRFEDTCAEATELLQEREYISKREKACKMIFDVNTEIPPSDVKGDRSKSVLFDACRLAKALQSLEKEEKWSKEEKWEMISHVWVEMLCHAACHCRGLIHAKQLSKGGELLTHVWLLMAHLGITEQFQISQGHARAKLLLS